MQPRIEFLPGDAVRREDALDTQLPNLRSCYAALLTGAFAAANLLDVPWVVVKEQHVCICYSACLRNLREMALFVSRMNLNKLLVCNLRHRYSRENLKFAEQLLRPLRFVTPRGDCNLRQPPPFAGVKLSPYRAYVTEKPNLVPTSCSGLTLDGIVLERRPSSDLIHFRCPTARVKIKHNNTWKRHGKG